MSVLTSEKDSDGFFEIPVGRGECCLRLESQEMSNCNINRLEDSMDDEDRDEPKSKTPTARPALCCCCTLSLLSPHVLCLPAGM